MAYVNYDDETLVSGTSGNDTIENYGEGVTIDAGAGNDEIDNKAISMNTSINGGAGNDLIYNTASKVTMNGGAGKDTLDNNDSENVTLLGGADDDYIRNWNSKNVSINGGDGDDTIEPTQAVGATVTGGKGNDIVYNGTPVGVTYLYTAGNDTIEGFDEYHSLVISGTTWSTLRVDSDIIVKIKGQGVITLRNYWSDTVNIYSSLDQVKSCNYINNNDGNKTITGTSDNDYIDNNGDNVTVLCGDGDDTVSRTEIKNVSISGGKGNDKLEFSGANITVSGGAGNDWSSTWYGAGNAYVYTSGNDTISYSGGTENSQSIVIADSWSSVRVDSSTVLIKIPNKGTITLENYTSDNLNIVSSLSDAKRYNIIYNDTNNKVITNTNNETFVINFGEKVTISDGSGSNVIRNCNEDASISCGAGDDTVDTGGDDVTVEGGKGNDWIHNHNNFGVFKYAMGDGDDTIIEFDDTSMLSITGGSYSTQVSGGDVIVTVGNGKILLAGAAGLSTVRINDANFMAPSEIVTYNGHSYGLYNEKVTWEEAKARCEELGGHLLTITDSGEQEVIQNLLAKYGKRSGYWMGGSDENTDGTWEWLTGETFDYSNWASGEPNGASNENHIEIYPGDGTWNDYHKDAERIGFICEWDDYTPTLTPTVDSKNITLTEGNDTYTNAVSGVTIQALGGNDTVKNFANNVVIEGGAGNDSLTGGTGKDTLNGGKGDDTLTGGAGADTFLYTSGDGNDVITDYAAEDKISILSGAASLSTSGDDVIATVGKGNITIKGGADKQITYVDKNGEQVYFDNGDTSAINSKTITLKDNYMLETFNLADYDKNIQTVDASAILFDISITGNKLANKITGSSQDDTIDGGAGADTIFGGDGNDSILGSKGNDSLSGGKGNDTLTGGAGADIFVYTKGDGNDVITDYDEDDTIQINSDTVSKTTAKNGNIIFTLASKKKITITGGADKVITYVDADGEHTYPETVKFNSKGTAATLTSAYSKDEFKINDYDDYKNSVVTINAAAVTHDLSITGNKLANKIIGSDEDDTIDGGNGADSIVGGKGADSLVGGKGDDTLEGGKGNDILTGGAGADIFIYNSGDGNDVITDYDEDDTIQINSDTVSKITAKNGNVIFTVGKNKITITGGADKIISYVDAEGEHTYPEAVKFNSKGTAATLTSAYSQDEFKINDYDDYKNSVVTINAAAVTHDLSITGNKLANKIIGSDEDDTIDGGDGADSILGGKGADSLVGGKGDDTLEGGTGNDILTGGKGADVFVYNSGDGNDIIADYAEADTIQINSATVGKITAKNGNVIFTVDKNKITITGGADKVISYVDAEGEHTYPEAVKFNSKGTAATLTSAYSQDEFKINDYDDYKNSVVMIDASAVIHDISITGNKLANKIIGSDEDDLIDGSNGADSILGGKGKDTLIGGKGDDTLEGGKGNDSLWGGAGDDTLYGGDGADIFVYNNGEGNDVIADFTKVDSIMILSGKVGDYVADSSNVTFEIGNGSIVVQGGVDKHIRLVDSSGNLLKSYSPNK